MGKTFTPLQQNWRWYEDNAATPTVDLELENTAPTLSDNSIIRLRIAIFESGGANGNSITPTLEYSLNNTDFVWSLLSAIKAKVQERRIARDVLCVRKSF